MAVVTVIAAVDMEAEVLEVETGVEVAVEDATVDLVKEETEVDVTEVVIEKEDTGNNSFNDFVFKGDKKSFKTQLKSFCHFIDQTEKTHQELRCSNKQKIYSDNILNFLFEL